MNRPSCSKDPDPVRGPSPHEGKDSLSDEDQVLKAEYLKLLDELNDGLDDAASGGTSSKTIVEVINKNLDAAEVLFKKISGRSAGELVLDSQVLSVAANCLTEASKNFDTGEGEFKLLEWVKPFKNKTKPTDEDEAPDQALNSAAHSFICDTMPTGWSPLNGSFDFSVEEIAVATKKKKQPKSTGQEAAKEPEKVSEHQQDTSVQQEVSNIYNHLKRLYKENNNQPLNYFKFFIDPTNLSRSMANMFHISFLVNDNKANLEKDEEAGLIISPISSKQRRELQNATTGARRNVSIMSLNMETWENLIEIHGIESAMF